MTVEAEVSAQKIISLSSMGIYFAALLHEATPYDHAGQVSPPIPPIAVEYTRDLHSNNPGLLALDALISCPISFGTPPLFPFLWPPPNVRLWTQRD